MQREYLKVSDDIMREKFNLYFILNCISHDLPAFENSNNIVSL